MMNQYEFIAWVSKMYPNYYWEITLGHTEASEITKVICDDVGFRGSYFKVHNYRLITDYEYQVIIDHIQEHEEVKSKLLFHEL